MTTHRRAWMGRAGVVVALILGAFVALPASPASADAPDVQITGLSSGTLTSGEQATLTFRVTNKNLRLPPINKDAVTVKVTTSFGELSCAGQCDFTDEIDREGSKIYTAKLIAGNVPPGETRSGKVQVRAQIGGDEAKAERDVTVRGPQPQQPATVAEISGKVTDVSTGDPVSGATVAIADSAGHRYDTETGDSGRFRFVGSAEKPIAPGDIQIGAQKGDVPPATKTINDVGAGKSIVGYKLVLRLTAPSSAAPTAEAASAEPTLADDAATDTAAAAPQPTAEDSGGFGSLMMILIGGLLVALGVGAIVLLWLRRRNENEDDAAVGARPGGGPVRPGYGGANDATRIGGAGQHDATMMNRPGLADAPTMMHNGPLVDEFPDPYGAPLPPPQQPTYPGQQGWAEEYGAPTQVGYGGPANPSSGGGYGNGPVSGGGYGPGPTSGGGYGAPEHGGPGHRSGYGEASPYGRRGYEAGPQGEPGGRRYGPESGYDRGPDHGDSGYDDRGGYGGGYDDRAGYGKHGGDRGGYDGGYGDRGGYDEPGHDRVPGQRDAGYADRGYDRGGYHDAPAGGGRHGGPPSGRGDRRSVDWLDD